VNYTANIDNMEVEKFSSIASKWWEPNGPCAPLHILNPCRLQFIQQHTQLQNKTVLDVGCGAGILTESLARNGSQVTGIDASTEIIEAAQEHAQQEKLNIAYYAMGIEEFMQQHEQQYDVVTCMELLEHVPDPAKLIQDCCALIKPGGQLFLSTINRNLKAYALAIIGAEYLLNILPVQTHNYKKFIRPAELADVLRTTALQLQDIVGINYQPFTKNASICKDVSVNYLAVALKVV
jgi:2-polyprenyl-6-hydroxyphenyl methylase/3-demethylubiquinone-9 3-methyltransferase